MPIGTIKKQGKSLRIQTCVYQMKERGPWVRGLWIENTQQILDLDGNKLKKEPRDWRLDDYFAATIGG